MTRAWLLLGLLLLAPNAARAGDAVDDAFARGSQAARDGRFEIAVQEFERAASLLEQPSSILFYNLGTAYAHLGEHGKATYHLSRALEFRGNPTAELIEATRHNLALVRQQAEIEAVAANTQLQRAHSWWDLLLEALRSQGTAWVSLLAGWLLLGTFLLPSRRRSQRGDGAFAGIRILLAAIYLGLGGLHALALRADRTAPSAIVLSRRLDAREGPGGHRKVSLTLQGGARVRVVERSPGWALVRLPGGLQGWVPERELGMLPH